MLNRCILFTRFHCQVYELELRNSHQFPLKFSQLSLNCHTFAQITGHVFKSLCERHRSRAQRFSGFTAFEVGWTYLASKRKES